MFTRRTNLIRWAGALFLGALLAGCGSDSGHEPRSAAGYARPASKAKRVHAVSRPAPTWRDVDRQAADLEARIDKLERKLN